MPALSSAELRTCADGEPSAAVRTRAERARRLQRQRFPGKPACCSAQMTAGELRRHCALEPAAERLLEAALDRLALSARAYGRILKVARTLADLAGEEHVRAAHLAEAIQYRLADGMP